MAHLLYRYYVADKEYYAEPRHNFTQLCIRMRFSHKSMSYFFSLFLFIIFIVFILTLLVCKWYLLKSSVLAAILSFRSHRLPYYPPNLVLNLQCSSLFVSRSGSSDCKSKNELPLFLYGLGILLPCLFYINFLLWLFFFSVCNVDSFLSAHMRYCLFLFYQVHFCHL